MSTLEMFVPSGPWRVKNISGLCFSWSGLDFLGSSLEMNFNPKIVSHWKRVWSTGLEVNESQAVALNAFTFGGRSPALPHTFYFHFKHPSCYILLCYIAQTMTLIKPSSGNTCHVLGKAKHVTKIPGMIVQSCVQHFKKYCHWKDPF